MRRKRWFMPLVAAASLAATMLVPSASAHTRPPPGSDVAGDDFYYNHHAHAQHGPETGHLPGSVENVELVGKRKLTNQEGDISDVSALGSFAYLGDWGAKCQTGGVHIVDFSDPSNPTKVGFLNAGGTGYQTEGIQALHIDTTEYTGDILVVSNEWCLAKSNPKQNPGGITIYDIDDPTNPVRLVQAFGDFDVHGNRANESHSAIAWDTGEGDAYVAAIDNEEVEDVDLFEITDPQNPVLVAETELPGVHVDGHGELKTSHDFDVLQFPDGSWHLMVSDWDAGWVDVDVTDPANPTIVGETDYPDCDQIVPTACPPEGNAHQGEWNSTGTVFVGTDEDFDSYRTSPLTRVTGPGAPETYPTVAVGGAPVTVLPDTRLNGPVAYGGYGCPGTSTPIPSADSVIPPGSLDPGEEQIIVLQRGPVDDPDNTEAACFPGEKADNATDQGWDAVILTSRHLGDAASDDPPNCGFGAFPTDEQIVAVCTNHTAMHELFGRTPDFTLPYPAGDPDDLEPDIGEVGFEVDITATFDGWGYTRVFDTSDPTAPTEVSQITIPETADEDFGIGFGDLTVHEVEVPRGDPNEGGPGPDDDKVAYFSWYAGGFRVVDITDPSNPQELGHYIDPKGNNFWGVALAEDQNGDRIVLASDRDFGLFIFRFTGALPA
ncbi:MAG: LVIVD repeat-containing protein [Actinomycetota bacterium]